jgi:uncharacterized protein GlcG (DUF336 family)
MQENGTSAISRRSALKTGAAIGVGVAALSSLGRNVSAQDATPAAGGAFTVSSESLTLDGAMAVIQAALAKATELGVPEYVVVVDTAGNIKAAARQDGAGITSLTYAPAKAYTAAAFGAQTDQLSMALSGDAGLVASILKDPRVILLGGGSPLKVGDALVGGVGVSGGSAEQDQECANAGAATLTV